MQRLKAYKQAHWGVKEAQTSGQMLNEIQEQHAITNECDLCHH